MIMVFVVFGVMLLIVTGMAVGVIFGKKPISGSCGGMSAVGMESACDVCGGDKTRCEKESSDVASQDQDTEFYDAGGKS